MTDEPKIETFDDDIRLPSLGIRVGTYHAFTDAQLIEHDARVRAEVAEEIAQGFVGVDTAHVHPDLELHIRWADLHGLICAAGSSPDPREAQVHPRRGFVPRRVYVVVGSLRAAEQVRVARGLSPDEVVVANSRTALRGMAFCIAEVFTHEQAASALGLSTVEAIMRDIAIIRSTHNRSACPQCSAGSSPDTTPEGRDA